MQTLKKGSWRELPTRRQRRLAVYTLAFPQAQALLGLYVPFSLMTILSLKAPVLVALVSFLPVLTLFGHFLISAVGLYEFAGAHDLKVSPGAILGLAIGWIPYQLLVSYASLRALLRHLRGISNWEKTAHIGAHRELADDQREVLGKEPSRVALFQQGAGESAAGGGAAASAARAWAAANAAGG